MREGTRPARGPDPGRSSIDSERPVPAAVEGIVEYAIYMPTERHHHNGKRRRAHQGYSDDEVIVRMAACLRKEDAWRASRQTRSKRRAGGQLRGEGAVRKMARAPRLGGSTDYDGGVLAARQDPRDGRTESNAPALLDSERRSA